MARPGRRRAAGSAFALAALLAGAALLAPSAPAAQDAALSERARAADANGNGVIDRDEAGGPLGANFEAIDRDRSGTLDGAEIRAFFQGGGGRRPGGGGGPPPPRVTVDRVIREPLVQTFPVIGRLVARQSGVVAARIGGAVAQMRVDVGDHVERGDVIAVISKARLASARDRFAAVVARYQGMLATAKAEYQKQVQELERQGNLKNSAAFSRAQFEDAERDVQSRRGSLAERRAQLREAQAQLREAKIDLADTEIKAPFAGVVTAKHTEVGSYLTVGARVVSLLNDREIEIEVEVPTDRVGGLVEGSVVGVRLDDGSRHRAVVRAVVPQEDVRTRTRPVRLTPRFGPTSKSLAANQSVTVDVPLGAPRMVVTVHKDAVVRRGTQAFVYVVDGNSAERRIVKLGDGIGGRFVVLEGLETDDRVVVRGNEALGRGGMVTVVGTLAG